MPDWLWFRYSSLDKEYGIDVGNANNRVYPPAVWTANEGVEGVDDDKIELPRLFLADQIFKGYSPKIPVVVQREDDSETIHAWETYSCLSLFYDHELYGILKGLKGRPPERRKQRGREAHYADRLAVQCAFKKDQNGMSDYKIARKFRLPYKHRYISYQSDTVRHLVERGRRLIESVELS